MNTRIQMFMLMVFAVSIFLSCEKEQAPISPVALAEEAYIFGLPLVTMDLTRRQATNVTAPVLEKMQAPMNQFAHLPVFPDANFTAVVRPNADTYYSNAWLDLSQGPIILSLPSGNQRYHLMQIMDAYTNVFGTPGTRVTNCCGGKFLISGPDWTGSAPGPMIELKSSTNYVWIIGRTEVKDPVDGATVVGGVAEEACGAGEDEVGVVEA
jgi:DNA sulfur modification protein DndE